MEERFSFIADVHLGRLARMLRMLGFDTVYCNDLTQKQLAGIALADNRVLLSRNPAFSKAEGIRFLQIESENAFEQLVFVIDTSGLREKFNPFSRCLVCNGILSPVEKAEVTDQLEMETKTFIHNFWQCETCRQVYWKGAHYNRMQNLIAKLEHNLKINKPEKFPMI